MDQNNPNNSGIGSGSSGFGTGTSGTTGTGSTASGSGFNTGGTGSGMSSGGGMSTTGSGGTGSPTGGFGVTSASDTGVGGDSGLCPHCGQSIKGGSGLEQFLGRLGITEEMIGNLKTQFQNVEIDEYLNTARDYLKDGSGKAQTYAKENPGKVAAGVAALALGAGLLYAAVNRDK
jgi:hypothetical protein